VLNTLDEATATTVRSVLERDVTKKTELWGFDPPSLDLTPHDRERSSLTASRSTDPFTSSSIAANATMKSHSLSRWICVCLIVTLIYYSLAIPFQIAFMSGNPFKLSEWSIDFAVDFLALVLLIIASRYRLKHSSRIQYCMAVLLPFELLFAYTPSLMFGAFGASGTVALIRVPKIAVISVFIRQFPRELAFLRRKDTMGQATLNALKLGAIFGFATHIIACVWFHIAYQALRMNTESWIYVDAGRSVYDTNLVVTQKTGEQYVFAVYWAVATLTSTGYGDIHAMNAAEAILSLVVMIGGGLFFAYFVAVLQSLVAELDVSSALFSDKVSRVKNFFRCRGISQALFSRTRTCLNTLWTLQLGVSDEELLTYIPQCLRDDIKADFFYTTLANTLKLEPYPVFIQEICNTLQIHLFLPYECVFDVGEVVNSMFVVRRGKAEVATDHGSFLLCRGKLCGHREFASSLQENRLCVRQYSVQARTLLSIGRITKSAIKRLLDDPRWQKTCQNMLEKLSSTPTAHHVPDDVSDDVSADVSENVSEAAEVVITPTTVTSSMQPISVVSECGVTHPFSSAFHKFGLIMLWNTILIAVVIPLRIVFSGPNASSRTPSKAKVWMFTEDILVDFGIFVQILANLFFFARVHGGMLITKRREFMRVYMRTNFVFDVISALPIDEVAYFIFGVDDAFYLVLMRLNRLLRVVYLPSLFHIAVEYLEEHALKLSSGMIRLVKMFCLAFLCVHWLACSFFVLAYAEVRGCHLLIQLSVSNESGAK
jgi:hypothetical protein